jgi:flagellar basal body rod protein FlgG
MINGMYISAMGMQTQQYRQGVFANNLANVQTPGFKRQFANLMDRPNAANEDPTMAQYKSDPIYGNMNGGVWLDRSTWDWTQGTLVASGNKTDLGLSGEGFFQVRRPDGQILLTRNGHFITTSEGKLVTQSNGYELLNTEGEPVEVKPNLPFSVSTDGVITQGETTPGQIAIVKPNDQAGLEPIGAGMNRVREGFTAAAADANTTIRQGFVEQSGVDPVTEMVQMLEGQRTFEANARMLSLQDQMLTKLNMIGRIA